MFGFGKKKKRAEDLTKERGELPNLLEAQKILAEAEAEIKEKMKKPRLLVKAETMTKKQLDEINKGLNEDSDQYIWVFDKPVESIDSPREGEMKTYCTDCKQKYYASMGHNCNG